MYTMFILSSGREPEIKKVSMNEPLLPRAAPPPTGKRVNFLGSAKKLKSLLSLCNV